MTRKIMPLSSRSDEITLRLGLWNVENLFLLFDEKIEKPTHGQLKFNEAQWQKLSTSTYDNKSLAKCQQIASIINENKPDIVMLCEVGGVESLNNFNNLFLDLEYSVALIEGNSDRHIDVGFLIRKTSTFFFDLISNRHRLLNLSTNPQQPVTFAARQSSGPFFSRDCVELKLFKVHQEEPFLIVLLTHLKSRLDPERIDPGGVERRRAEFRTALDLYQELKNRHSHTPILLAGDMNGFAGTPNTDPEFVDLYSETDLLDVLEVAKVPTEHRATFYQIKNGSRAEGKQIDYCFLPKSVHPKLMAPSVSIYRYKDEFGLELDTPRSVEQKSLLPSDHYPLFFTLEKLKF